MSGDAAPRPDPREALTAALSAHFAVERLGSAGVAYLYASALPSLVLWVHGWHPLPGLVVWLAVLGWGSFGCLAAVFSWAAWRSQARLAAALPEARRVVRVQFSPVEPVPLASSLLLLLSVGASAVLWANGVAPGLVAPDILSLSTKAWVLLVAAALGNRYLEALS
jgi:hypothetical protein